MSYSEETLKDAEVSLNNLVSAVKTTPQMFSPRPGVLKSIQDALDIKPQLPYLNGIYAYVEIVFGWIPLNPNDIERVRALVSAYYIPGYEGFDPSKSTLEWPHPISKEYGTQITTYNYSDKIPTINGLISLFDCVTKHPNQFIAISGRRGSGKTMALNFFLTTAHRQLAEKGVLWFRTDIAKLWAIIDEDSLSVTQYTILHSIYIALKYSNKDINLKAMQRLNANGEPDIKGEPGKLFTDYLKNIPKDQAFIDIWEKLVKAFLDVERLHDRPGEKPVANFLELGARLIKGGASHEILDIYTEMTAFLKASAKSEGRALKILIILDGVDNVRVGAHQEEYFKLLGEINKMFLGFPRSIGDKYILVARPETFVDFSYQRTSMGNGLSTLTSFEIDSDFIAALLDKKTAAITNPNEYFQNAAMTYTNKKHISFAEKEDFSNSINFLLKRLEGANLLNPTLTDEPNHSEKSKPINLIFDGNIRSMLRNFIRAHYHKNRLTKVSWQRALIEGSVLAGCSYTMSNLNEDVRGRWCPNLFEGASINDGRWTGLVMVRLIQLLSAVSGGVSYEEVLDFLKTNFSHDHPQSGWLEESP